MVKVNYPLTPFIYVFVCLFIVSADLKILLLFSRLLSILSLILMLTVFQNQQVAIPFVPAPSPGEECRVQHVLTFCHQKDIPGSSYTVLAPESIISLRSSGTF